MKLLDVMTSSCNQQEAVSRVHELSSQLLCLVINILIIRFLRQQVFKNNFLLGRETRIGFERKKRGCEKSKKHLIHPKGKIRG